MVSLKMKEAENNDLAEKLSQSYLTVVFLQSVPYPLTLEIVLKAVG